MMIKSHTSEASQSESLSFSRSESESDESESKPEVIETEHSSMPDQLFHKIIDIDQINSDEKNSGSCDILKKVINEAGECVEEIIVVEVWMCSEDEKAMIPIGWWVDPTIEIISSTITLSQLTDKRSIGYIPPFEQDNGKSLASMLFHEQQECNKHISWKLVSCMKYDSEDKLRYSLLAYAGFGLVAGVHFDSNGHTGVVVYVSKSDANMEHLCSEANILYMSGAAELIGAVSKYNKVKLRLKQDRQKESKAKGNSEFDKSHNTLLEPLLSREQDYCDDVDPADVTESNFYKFVKKFRGGPDNPSPHIPVSECFWILISVFITMFTIAITSRSIYEITDDDLLIQMGPLGALMILQFGLSTVPAAQPYNILFGQMTAALISMFISYLSPFELPAKISLSFSISCSIMVALGFTHPPAGAAAVIFSARKYTWASCGLLLLGNVIAIIMSTILNNLHKNRHYPAYWGFANFRRLISDVTIPIRYVYRKIFH